MKLGIIGTGMIVETLLEILPTIPEIEVKALLSTPRSNEKRRQLQEAYGIAKGYDQQAAFLADKELEVIYVGSPNHLHTKMVIAALEAGKHVICEKPFTATLAELEAIEQVMAATGRYAVEAITSQYIGHYQEIKQHIGELGTIKIVEANYSQYSSRYDAFKQGEILPAFDPEKAGGALMDINLYNIHFVVGLFGPPQTVTYLANQARGIDTSGVLLLDYGTFKAVCIGAKDSQAKSGALIQGEAGYLEVTGPSSMCERFTVNQRESGRQQSFAEPQPHRMYPEFVAFERFFREEQWDKLAAAFLHSKQVMTVIEHAKRSATQGE